MKKLLFFFTLLCTCTEYCHAQNSKQRQEIMNDEETNVKNLKKMAKIFKQEEIQAAKRVEQYCIKNKVRKITTDSSGSYSLMVDVLKGVPVYIHSNSEGGNKNAVEPSDNTRTISTDRVQVGGDLGFNLTGSGINISYYGSGVPCRANTPEFNGRITLRNNRNDYSTEEFGHIQGAISILTANGINRPEVGGMAPLSTVQIVSDRLQNSTMMEDALNGHSILVCRSAGPNYGWQKRGTGNRCDGNRAWAGESGSEDSKFGRYDSSAHKLDDALYNARYLLFVQAAGNERGTILSPSDITNHYFTKEQRCSDETREQDGGEDGFDCLGSEAVSKNALVVGAVEQLNSGYQRADGVISTSYSSWGPTDDGRIKPDIVSAGEGYTVMSNCTEVDPIRYNGTSAATPSVAGSIALLQELSGRVRCGNLMKAATVKALLIHTSDECGPHQGPDYMFGWGLMNTAKAALMINAHSKFGTMYSVKLTESRKILMPVNIVKSQPFRITACWTDAPGKVARLSLNNRSKNLVNDIDIRVVNNNNPNEVYFPYRLNVISPAAMAERGDNNTDNVEQIFIENLNPGSYSIVISHKGKLSNQKSWVSVIRDTLLYRDDSCKIIPLFNHPHSASYSTTPSKLISLVLTGCEKICIDNASTTLNYLKTSCYWVIKKDGIVISRTKVINDCLPQDDYAVLEGEYEVYVEAAENENARGTAVSNVLSYRRIK